MEKLITPEKSPMIYCDCFDYTLSDNLELSGGYDFTPKVWCFHCNQVVGKALVVGHQIYPYHFDIDHEKKELTRGFTKKCPQCGGGLTLSALHFF